MAAVGGMEAAEEEDPFGGEGLLPPLGAEGAAMAAAEAARENLGNEEAALAAAAGEDDDGFAEAWARQVEAAAVAAALLPQLAPAGKGKVATRTTRSAAAAAAKGLV